MKEEGKPLETDKVSADGVPTSSASEIVTEPSAANTSTVSVDSTNGEHDPYYEPVISLPEVDIITNEEEEEVLYKQYVKIEFNITVPIVNDSELLIQLWEALYGLLCKHLLVNIT